MSNSAVNSCRMVSSASSLIDLKLAGKDIGGVVICRGPDVLSFVMQRGQNAGDRVSIHNFLGNIDEPKTRVTITAPVGSDFQLLANNYPEIPGPVVLTGGDMAECLYMPKGKGVGSINTWFVSVRPMAAHIEP